MQAPMLRRACTFTVRHIQLFGVTLYVSNKFLQVPWRKVFPCDDQFRYLKNCTNWLEIDIWLVRKVGVKRERERMGSCVTHQDGIAVGSCAHCAGRARRTAGTSDILNDELLPEQPRHVLADDASTDVSCPASSDWHDDRDCPRWIGFRSRDTRKSRQRGSACCQMQKLPAMGKFHFEPPSPFRSFDH